MTRRIRQILRRLRDDTGAATIEFVILFPVIFALFVSAMDAGILMTRQVLLERAVDIVVRDIRLGRATGDHAAMRREICANTVMMPNCNDILLIEMRPISMQTWGPLDAPTACIDRAEDVEPVTTFTAGAPNQLTIIRVCARFDPLFPQTPLGLNLPGDGQGGYALATASAFVTEP
jgi:hypothetical protein